MVRSTTLLLFRNKLKYYQSLPGPPIDAIIFLNLKLRETGQVMIRMASLSDTQRWEWGQWRSFGNFVMCDFKGQSKEVARKKCLQRPVKFLSFVSFLVKCPFKRFAPFKFWISSQWKYFVLHKTPLRKWKYMLKTETKYRVIYICMYAYIYPI